VQRAETRRHSAINPGEQFPHALSIFGPRIGRISERIVRGGRRIIGSRRLCASASDFRMLRSGMLEKKPPSVSIRAATTAACFMRVVLQAGFAKVAAGGARDPTDGRVLQAGRAIAHESVREMCRSRLSRRRFRGCTRCSERGTANGLTGLRRLTGEQLREIEPHAAGIAAIHCTRGRYRRLFACVPRAWTAEISKPGGGSESRRARVTAIRRDGRQAGAWSLPAEITECFKTGNLRGVCTRIASRR
jgi:hypothetical protein